MRGGDYLFVGGPKDGKRLTTACDPVRVATANSDGTGFEYTEYRAFRLAGELDERVVFLESSLSPDEAIALLVCNYRPTESKQLANLTVLVGRLVRQLRKHDATNDVATKAMDYLLREDLMPSPIRDAVESDSVL